MFNNGHGFEILNLLIICKHSGESCFNNSQVNDFLKLRNLEVAMVKLEVDLFNREHNEQYRQGMLERVSISYNIKNHTSVHLLNFFRNSKKNNKKQKKPKSI